MEHQSYLEKRERLEEYFDRTAADQWAKLTSDAPVSGIRKTVRAGRDRMRETLLSWLPADLRGRLDAQIELECSWRQPAEAIDAMHLTLATMPKFPHELSRGQRQRVAQHQPAAPLFDQAAGDGETQSRALITTILGAFDLIDERKRAGAARSGAGRRQMGMGGHGGLLGSRAAAMDGASRTGRSGGHCTT